MRVVYLFLLGAAVAIFLFLRNCVDRKVEKVTGKEIVREDEEYLGSWASKSKESYISFRLRRDGTFNYMLVNYPGNDTNKITGKYELLNSPSGDIKYFPRLCTFNANGDTLFNYFIRSITPYNSTDKYSKMVLSPNSVYDTIEYLFYRIKQ